jgi:membrane-associated phospholipid phosphatase
MLIVIVIASQIGKAIPIKRPSATFAFPEALRISELVPGVFAKDTASDSFPGDHGLVLLLFAGFVAFYMPRIYGIIAGIMMVLFTMPRLMGGSHWLTDEIVGALAVGIMCLSWVMATPLQNVALNRIEGWVERRRSIPSRT